MLLGICPNELKTCIHTKICTKMYIAALFTFAKTWKYPTRSSVGKWINWYIQTTEYYLALKSNEL